jgi:hypothetical protein
MNANRRGVGLIALAIVGFVLLVIGALLYQGSIANVQQVNNNCRSLTTCVTEAPNPLFLYVEYFGAALLALVGLLGVRASWSSGGHPRDHA